MKHLKKFNESLNEKDYKIILFENLTTNEILNEISDILYDWRYFKYIDNHVNDEYLVVFTNHIIDEDDALEIIANDEEFGE